MCAPARNDCTAHNTDRRRVVQRLETASALSSRHNRYAFVQILLSSAPCSAAASPHVRRLKTSAQGRLSFGRGVYPAAVRLWRAFRQAVNRKREVNHSSRITNRFKPAALCMTKAAACARRRSCECTRTWEMLPLGRRGHRTEMRYMGGGTAGRGYALAGLQTWAVGNRRGRPAACSGVGCTVLRFVSRREDVWHRKQGAPVTGCHLIRTV